VINSDRLLDGYFVGSAMTEVSKNHTKLTPQDLKVIVVYLKSIPSIRNKVSSKK
jgi:hypothetical protein|tara:strand:- start:320 stop:481 length:162 start_codon:yes stop_codon:yes gene_type:complete